MLWGIDRGLVCNFLILSILFYLLFLKEYKKLLFLFILSLIPWFLFFISSKNEFIYFFNNTITIFKEMNYIHGLIHPKPFTNELHSARATKTLLAIVFTNIIAIHLIPAELLRLKNPRIFFVLGNPRHIRSTRAFPLHLLLPEVDNLWRSLLDILDFFPSRLR